MARTIRTKVYKFNELSENAKTQAISDQIHFEISLIDGNSHFWEAAQEMERMQTPWFLGEKIYHDPELRQIIINDIIIGNLEFTQDGKIFNS